MTSDSHALTFRGSKSMLSGLYKLMCLLHASLCTEFVRMPMVNFALGASSFAFYFLYQPKASLPTGAATSNDATSVVDAPGEVNEGVLFVVCAFFWLVGSRLPPAKHGGWHRAWGGRGGRRNGR